MQLRKASTQNTIHNKSLWKDIPGYEGLYAACHYGFIMSYISGRVLVNQVFKAGYVYVTLCKNGVKKNVSLHRIIAKTFLPNPDNKPEVNHIGGNKRDNHYANLEWATESENKKHAYATGLNKGSKPMLGRFNELSPRAKSVEQCDLQGNLIKVWPSVSEAVRHGFQSANICKCCKGQRPTHKGFTWKYLNN